MLNHKLYVPIIKSKAGELWALRHLGESAKAMTTPLLEVLAHKKLPTAIHAPKVCDAIAAGWGTKHRIFIDTVYLGTETALNAASLGHYFRAANSLGIQSVPVTSLGRSQSFQQAVQRIVNSDGRGAAFRLGVRDFVDPDILARSIASLLNLLGLRPPKVDIIIDYGARTDEAELIQLARLHLRDLPQITHWRSVTVAAGSFPNSLMQFSQDRWHQVSRHEWRAWVAAMTLRTPPPRFPSFGDYGIRDPGAPADFGTPSANLRYTSDAYWLVRRGRLVRNAGAADMPGICRSLLQLPEWCLAPFSAGDHEIERIAASQDSTGNATQWVQWCMSHHFEYVAQQIRSLPEP